VVHEVAWTRTIGLSVVPKASGERVARLLSATRVERREEP